MRIGVLLSGNGTTMSAISIHHDVAVVISDVEEAYGLERADILNIPSHYVNPKDSEFHEKVLLLLEEYGVELVCLAGYLRLVKDPILYSYKNKIMNLHPALLPAFPGRDPQKQALEHGAKVTGNTIHFVDKGCDTGPIIMQSAEPIFENDTEEALSRRLTLSGHALYINAIEAYKQGKVEIRDNKCQLRI